MLFVSVYLSFMCVTFGYKYTCCVSCFCETALSLRVGRNTPAGEEKMVVVVERGKKEKVR